MFLELLVFIKKILESALLFPLQVLPKLLLAHELLRELQVLLLKFEKVFLKFLQFIVCILRLLL